MSIVVHLAVGGHSVGKDVAVLRKGAQVVVGTPGRVGDLIRNRLLDLRHVRLVILDEADEVSFRNHFQLISEGLKISFRCYHKDSKM
jgi:superfamily II DNA/RNA helicase